MLNIIQNNPYRFLGVCSNAPTAERLANSRKLSAFLKVNKEVTFPLDFTHLLPSIKRTADGMNTANSSINLPKDQLKYALFWFINDSTIDNMALDYLKAGNKSKASELFSKKETFSSLINKGVLAFIDGNNGEGIQCVTKVIHDDDYRIALVEAICGSTFHISEEDLSQLFIDTLLEEITVGELKDLFEQYGTSSDDDDLLREKTIGEPIATINSAIAQAKSIKNDDAHAQYQAGVQLMNTTKDSLASLEEILFTGEYVMEDVAMLDIGLPIQVPRKVYDDQYIFIADSLAKQILQCGINYYNNTEEEDYVAIDKALELQNYALSISVGKLTKDRCRENVNILNTKKDELPPKEARYYDTKIKDALSVYMNQPNKISYAVDLIKKVVPYLMSIKEVLGGSNTYYLKISTLIVNASLHNIIEEFNSVMNDNIKLEILLDRAGTMRKVKNIFDQAWKATLYMDKLDMEPEFKSGRYNQNRSALKGQVEQVVNIYQTVSLDMRGETRMFNDCRSVSDCDKYLKIFPGGKYASQVKSKKEKCEFDACKTTQDCEAFRRKYPNSKYDILSKWEDCYYNSCNTIPLLKSYLKDYPSGKYVSKAKDRIDFMSYSACKSITDFNTYVRDFPNGKYVASAKEKIDNMSFESCSSLYQFKNYLNQFPNGKHRVQAQRIIREEEMWARCTSSNSKDLYKQYLAQFPNGRHKTEAEQKASACYIATMVYGDYNHPQVVALRGFRDNILHNSALGRAFIRFYYKYSPSLVEKMQDKKTINSIIKSVLDKFIKLYNYEGK